jgi:4-hydroxy-2-oxoglutarate aldolase
MADLGVDAALIRTPSYFKSRLDDEALKHHFLTIADRSKIPIIVYNIPIHTGITLSPHVIIELSRHPNIIGIKDSSGNLASLGEVKPYLHEEFHFLLGAASILLPGLILGADGGIITVSSVAPKLSTDLYDLYKKNELKQAIKIQFRLIPLNKALIQTYGVPAVKYALDLLGFYGGPPRKPLHSLTEEGKREVREILKTLGLIDQAEDRRFKSRR